ncbi:16S rRNA (cytosine(1402)-N(4))-methyltransferase, partial [uncultured Aeromicrobium sp.]|uniref:16S rRNA (cytosine(1402)-N(4))-methyltransferase n=1 Tax=uncultured Aeromicrobium sp. TaxID=337820 RepID=UPI00342FAAED
MRAGICPHGRGDSGERVRPGGAMTSAQHVPVLRERVVALLAPAVQASAAPVVVDATLGLGGHAEALLQRFGQLRV